MRNHELSTSSTAVQQFLTSEEMEQIVGGKANPKVLAFACGAGIAASIMTGGLGLIVYGPSTVAMCIAAYNA